MPDETIIQLANGWTLRSEAGDNVRLCESDGTERIYWDQNEWHEDPVSVMAAIFGAATRLPADNPDSVKLRLTRALTEALSRRAAGAHPATYLTGRINEPGIAMDDAGVLMAWDYDPTNAKERIVVTESDSALTLDQVIDEATAMGLLDEKQHAERGSDQDKAQWRCRYSDELTMIGHHGTVADLEAAVRKEIRLYQLAIDPDAVDYAALGQFIKENRL